MYMTTSTNRLKITGVVQVLAAVLLAASFFMPWIIWDGAAVKGSDMPSGSFFTIAEAKSGIANPFPGLSFAFYAFYLIPALSVVIVTATLLKKNTFWLAAVAGALSISVVIVYCLFTTNIAENGLISASSKELWLYVQVAAAVLLILTAGAGRWPLKLAVILLTVLGTYFGFKAVSGKLEKDLMNEGHQSTDQVKTDYMLSADTLLKEFIANDTASNNKYREKMLEVNGLINATEIAADSTSTLKFADSTGSYAIFSIEKTELEKVKTIKTGDIVTVKGICSGSIFSEILGTTSVNFKRAVVKQKQ
jgi:tRNA_anti-like